MRTTSQCRPTATASSFFFDQVTVGKNPYGVNFLFYINKRKTANASSSTTKKQIQRQRQDTNASGRTNHVGKEANRKRNPMNLAIWRKMIPSLKEKLTLTPNLRIHNKENLWCFAHLLSWNSNSKGKENCSTCTQCHRPKDSLVCPVVWKINQWDRSDHPYIVDYAWILHHAREFFD
jgi:hypothetical protein